MTRAVCMHEDRNMHVLFALISEAMSTLVLLSKSVHARASFHLPQLTINVEHLLAYRYLPPLPTLLIRPTISKALQQQLSDKFKQIEVQDETFLCLITLGRVQAAVFVLSMVALEKKRYTTCVHACVYVYVCYTFR